MANASHPDSSPLPIPTLLSLSDVARVLNVNRRAVERLRSAGRLPRPDLTVGRHLRWRPETITNWVKRGGR